MASQDLVSVYEILQNFIQGVTWRLAMKSGVNHTHMQMAIGVRRAVKEDERRPVIMLQLAIRSISRACLPAIDTTHRIVDVSALSRWTPDFLT
jgi:hypothetical protein